MRDFVIILVRPRDPNNIGACARAMANFGLSQLRLVDPYPPVWQEAVSAVGAQDILKQARLFPTLQEALADTDFSFATTALKEREIKQEIYFLPQWKDFSQKLHFKHGAFVFGNEKSGLSAQDIELCNAVLNIPTSAKQPSVNLAQAVLLVCYEIAQTQGLKPLRQLQEPLYPTHHQQEVTIQELDSLFQEADLYANWPAAHRQALIRNFVSKQHLELNALFLLKNLAEKLRKRLR